MNATPLEVEFRQILQHIANAERLASNADHAALLAALKILESAAIDAMFDHDIANLGA